MEDCNVVYGFTTSDTAAAQELTKADGFILKLEIVSKKPERKAKWIYESKNSAVKAYELAKSLGVKTGGVVIEEYFSNYKA